RGTLGVARAVVGVLALDTVGGGLGARGPWPLLGNLLVFGAVVGEAVFVVCSRVASQRLSPLVVATAISALGFAMFLPGALLEMRAFPLSRLALADWAMVGYDCVVVTVMALLRWARGGPRVGARASS